LGAAVVVGVEEGITINLRCVVTAAVGMMNVALGRGPVVYGRLQSCERQGRVEPLRHGVADDLSAAGTEMTGW
jgi:hypothetical protein